MPYAAGAAIFSALRLPLLTEATLFLDGNCVRARGVERVHEWTVRRMRLATHLLSRVIMTFPCSNARYGSC